MKTFILPRHAFPFNQPTSLRGYSAFHVAIILLVALILLGTSAQAANIWDNGAGADDNWDLAGNWDNDIVPTNNATVTIGTFDLNPGRLTVDTSGERTVNALIISTTTAFSIVGGNTLTLTSGALTRNDVGGTEGNQTLGHLFLGAAGVFTINGDGTLTVSGVIGDGANTFSVTKEGSGILVLSGLPNTYGGDTIINGGTLRLGANDKIANGGNDGNVVINSSGTFDLAGFSDTIKGLSGSGIVDKSDIGGASTLTIGADTNSATFSGVIQNSDPDAGQHLNLIKTGTGTQILSGNNSHDGTNTIQTGGALNIQHGNALGSTDNGTIVENGGSLQIQGGITTPAEALTINGTGGGAGSLRNISGNNEYAGAVTIGSAVAALRINSDLDTLTLSGGMTEAGTVLKNLTIGGVGNVTISGVITEDGTFADPDLALLKDGAGTLTLSASNTYHGGTTLGTGTITLGADGALGDGKVTFNGGILNASNKTHTTSGALTLSSNSTINLVDDNGSDKNALAFGSISRTGGILTITGWDGVANASGTDDQIFVGSANPGATILANIQFTGFPIGATWLGAPLGEIVPSTQPAGPTLASPLRISDTAFQFTLMGTSNRSYTVQSSTNFVSWNSILTTNAPGDSFDIVDLDATNDFMFYRALLNQ